MKLIVFLSIALISSFCYAEPKINHQTGVACNTQCGVNGSSLFACLVLEFYTALITILCGLLKNSFVNIATFIACLADCLVPPFGAILQSILNGMIDGANFAASVCPCVLDIYNEGISELCPCLISNVNNVLSDLGDLVK